MEGKHYKRQVQCRICGSWTTSYQPYGTCDECKALQIEENNRKQRMKYEMKDKAIIVVFDPTGDLHERAI